MCHFVLVYSRHMKLSKNRNHLSEDTLWNFVENHQILAQLWISQCYWNIFMYIDTCNKIIHLFNQSMNFDEIYTIESCDGATYNEMLIDLMILFFIEIWGPRGMWVLSIPLLLQSNNAQILLISGLIFMVN